ncbi:DUF3375 family protein [Glutamicibacter sp. ZJUTW]|uniref:DUF3375 family protein n=1 Tax=Glutamicibacter sp. ZJUTW TaxID=1155384 RepID=UPI001FEFD868|nr:DUF3375 family protein [Glutamicibacter sp. ZJUTW]
MSAVHAALTAQRLLGESPAWALLRADNAPVAFGILGTRFSRQHRQVPASELAQGCAPLPNRPTLDDFMLPAIAGMTPGITDGCKEWF